MTAQAQSPDPTPTPTPDSEEGQLEFWWEDSSESGENKTEQTVEQKLIQENIEISGWFDGVADGLDLFLVGRRLTNKKNETRVRLESATLSTEGQAVTSSMGLSVDLRLPNLEKYWQLKFTTYDERRESGEAGTNYLRQNPRERNVGATVGVFRRLGNVRVAFQPRIELQDPLKVAHSLIFESVAEMKTYRINPKMELFANPTKGLGVFNALNFYLLLTKKYSLTFINESEYEEKMHKFSVGNGVSLGQFVTDRAALAYGFMLNSHNREAYHLDMYTLSVSWHHLLYKNILDYQLIPHVNFRKEERFRGRAGLTLNVNLSF